MTEKMKNIFRLPVDYSHYRDTMEYGKELDEISEYLAKEDIDRLKPFIKDGKIRYWGALPGSSNERNWKLMQEDDEVICYRSGCYIALAIIAHKTRNKELAKFSWGETDLGSTWEYIYFFKEIYYYNIDLQVLNKQFGFKPGPVMGLNILSAQVSGPIISKFGSLKNLVDSLRLQEYPKEEIKKAIEKKQIESPFEAQYYLLDLGKSLNLNTYLPPTDSGREVFGRKLRDLSIFTREHLNDYIPPKYLDPVSNIDIIWFENDRPRYFYEVVHKSGMKEAFARLNAVGEYYKEARTRIIGPEEIEVEYDNVRRLFFPSSSDIVYKNYDQLLETHYASVEYHKIVDDFLA